MCVSCVQSAVLTASSVMLGLFIECVVCSCTVSTRVSPGYSVTCATSSGITTFGVLLTPLFVVEVLRCAVLLVVIVSIVVPTGSVLGERGGAWEEQVVVRIRGIAAGTVRMVLVATVAVVVVISEVAVVVVLVVVLPIRLGTGPDLQK